MKRCIMLCCTTLVMLIALTACKNDEKVNNTPPTDDQTKSEAVESFTYEFVEPLESPLIVESGYGEFSTDEIFAMCNYVVRGTVTSIKELKEVHTQGGNESDTYSSVIELAVLESYGEEKLTYASEDTITISYPSSSYSQESEGVQLEEGGEYIFMLNDTAVNSGHKELDKYAQYSTLYSRYTVIAKNGKKYAAKDFMVNVLGVDESETKEAYTLKEVEKAIKPFLKKLEGRPVVDIVKSRNNNAE